MKINGIEKILRENLGSEIIVQRYDGSGLDLHLHWAPGYKQWYIWKIEHLSGRPVGIPLYKGANFSEALRHLTLGANGGDES